MNVNQGDTLPLLNQFLLGKDVQEGHTPSLVTGAGIFKASCEHKKQPAFYEPLVCLVVQGQKRCHVGDESFYYQKGDFFINVLPMPVASEIIAATAETPFLSVTLAIDLVKLADMLLKIERLEDSLPPIPEGKRSCLLVGKADEGLIDAFYRLMEYGGDQIDAAVLGSATVDEIYYRLLTSQYGYALRILLSQHGQIQPISKAVSFIHGNIDKPIQINELASLSNMSKTTFFNAFKRLMHVAPNQYIKSSKLQKAQTLLRNGMQANEASHRVGYNSFSQFSREYKRLFGYPPSATQSETN